MPSNTKQRDSEFTFFSSSPTVPEFTLNLAQPQRPQLTTLNSAQAQAQTAELADSDSAQAPSYDALHAAMLGGGSDSMTDSEKEKSDYYLSASSNANADAEVQGSHWADPPAGGFSSNLSSTRKGPPLAMTILQPPKAAFASPRSAAPATPNSPAAQAFGDESSSIRGERARRELNKSMDWSRFSILVKEKERKGGKKGSEWLNRERSTWRKYHKLGWMIAIVILIALATALGYHFTHLKDQVEPKALTLGGFNGGKESTVISSFKTVVTSTSSSAAEISTTTTTTSAGAATTIITTASPSTQMSTTRPPAVVVTSSTSRAVSSSAQVSAVGGGGRSSTTPTAASRSTPMVVKEVEKRFFNPYRGVEFQPIVDESVTASEYSAVEEDEELKLRKRATGGGWEGIEWLSAAAAAREHVQKRAADWREIEFSRPAAADEGRVKRHVEQYRRRRSRL